MAPTHISLVYPDRTESGNSWGGRLSRKHRRDKIKRANKYSQPILKA